MLVPHLKVNQNVYHELLNSKLLDVFEIMGTQMFQQNSENSDKIVNYNKLVIGFENNPDLNLIESFGNVVK